LYHRERGDVKVRRAYSSIASSLFASNLKGTITAAAVNTTTSAREEANTHKLSTRKNKKGSALGS
jgi:hypothetical protein